jgi:hypothetical protein
LDNGGKVVVVKQDQNWSHSSNYPTNVTQKILLATPGGAKVVNPVFKAHFILSLNCLPENAKG